MGKGNAGARAARLKNNAKNPGQMKPQPPKEETEVMCPACELLHMMCTHLVESIKKKNELPTKEILAEFRHMCLDMSECCGNPYHDGSDYSDDSEGDEVFWKNKMSPKQ